VGPHDVFPEEWLPFLSIPQELQELFLQNHGDLLTAAWWRAVALGAPSLVKEVKEVKEVKLLRS
jgi:isocitrate dehydrogenase kinase/phosphatase